MEFISIWYFHLSLSSSSTGYVQDAKVYSDKIYLLAYQYNGGYKSWINYIDINDTSYNETKLKDVNSHYLKVMDDYSSGLRKNQIDSSTFTIDNNGNMYTIETYSTSPSTWRFQILKTSLTDTSGWSVIYTDNSDKYNNTNNINGTSAINNTTFKH